MAPIAMVFGSLLILLGIGGYFGTGMISITALIPAFVGIPLLILGVLGRQEHLRKHTMHGAATVGLLGFLGGSGDFLRRLFTGKLEWGAGAVSLVLMIALCGIFVALCVKSFIDARRAREQRTEGPFSGEPKATAP